MDLGTPRLSYRNTEFYLSIIDMNSEMIPRVIYKHTITLINNKSLSFFTLAHLYLVIKYSDYINLIKLN